MLTYEDMSNDEWYLLMPDSVRESLSGSYRFYLDMAEKGVKAPSLKELQMTVFLSSLYSEDDE